jgi:hypothetical protein
MVCPNCARHSEADGVTIHVRNPYYKPPTKRDVWGFLTGVDRDGNEHHQHGFLAQADGTVRYAIPASVSEALDKAVKQLIYG